MNAARIKNRKIIKDNIINLLALSRISRLNILHKDRRSVVHTNQVVLPWKNTYVYLQSRESQIRMFGEEELSRVSSTDQSAVDHQK